MTASVPPSLHLSLPRWDAYELLDSGDGRKLERFGPVRVIRPEPKAWWSPGASPELWRTADAVFEDSGHWKKLSRNLPTEWDMPLSGLNLQARLSDGSKHLGLFPEQEPHWSWMRERLMRTSSAEPPRLLNLFGYTGVASLVAAQAGARVTHLDASKPAIQWGRDNQARSGLSDKPIRWILDDAVKFVSRELRRHQKYEAILLDPPSFGRGPKGELWKVEVKLRELLSLLPGILAPRPLFIILTLYNLEASALMAQTLLQDFFPKGHSEAGELVLPHSHRQGFLPLSLYVRWMPPT